MENEHVFVFGRRLCLALKKRKWRQCDFLIVVNDILISQGKKAISKNSLGLYCQGKVYPGVMRLKLFAHVLDVPVPWLPGLDVYDDVSYPFSIIDV